MSSVTTCNHCTLKNIRADWPGSVVGVLEEDDEFGVTWLKVVIDDEPAGVQFLELTDECVCHS